jgi:hypothetical protein
VTLLGEDVFDRCGSWRGREVNASWDFLDRVEGHALRRIVMPARRRNFEDELHEDVVRGEFGRANPVVLCDQYHAPC